jgi:hypothetical protein
MRKYWPLLCLILVAAVAAGAIDFGAKKGWMSYFMGFFLCQFALLKLFNPIQFADGFQMYDLIAKNCRAYAFAYPLIELILGLSYLALFLPILTAILTIIILGAGAVSVIRALIKGLDVRCACMGTILDVPLSTVTLTEDLGMVAMAILLLIYG